MERKSFVTAAAAVSAGIWIFICLLSAVLVGANQISLESGLILAAILLVLAGVLLISYLLYQILLDLQRSASGPSIELILSQLDRTTWDDLSPDLIPVQVENELRCQSNLEGIVQGRNGNLTCGLYLHNLTSGAGRMPQVDLHLTAHPRPSSVRFTYGADAKPDSSLRSLQASPLDKDEHTLLLRLNEALVIYQNIIYIGDLELSWTHAGDASPQPEKLLLEYRVYTLEGTSSGSVDVDVRWSGQ